MARLEAVDLPAPHGMLEGLLRLPDAEDARPARAAIVCHPHPQFGGTLHNKVVFRIAQALADAGIPALRFNFRGVGRSTGHFAEGRGEAEDVRASLDWVAARFPGAALWLAGFSFGAWVGLPVGCADARVTQVLGVGVPFSLLRMDSLSACTVPKAFIQGARDQYGSLDELWRWYEALAQPKTLHVVPEADHFFNGHLPELTAAVRAVATTGAGPTSA